MARVVGWPVHLTTSSPGPKGNDHKLIYHVTSPSSTSELWGWAPLDRPACVWLCLLPCYASSRVSDDNKSSTTHLFTNFVREK